MFKFFTKKNQEEKSSNQIELTTEEVNEIDEIIKNLQITYDELVEDVNGLKTSTEIYKIQDNLEDVPSEEAKEKLDFIKSKLNSVMDEFVSFQVEKLNEKLKSIESKLNVWKSLKTKIDSHLRLSVGEIEINSESLPISIFLNKILKTVNDNPNLLNEEQTKRMRSFISSLMEEAFKS
jgi:hypothetical protein